MSVTEKPRRRWFVYSLQTLFVLLTVFGVWLGVQVKWIRDRAQFVAQFHDVGEPGSAPAPWSIRILGAPGYKEIRLNAEQPYAQLEQCAPDRFSLKPR